jgi:hypothetical protein
MDPDFPNLSDICDITIRSLDEDTSISVDDVNITKSVLTRIEASQSYRPETKAIKDTLRVAIRSLDGQTVFPKEANETRKFFVCLREHSGNGDIRAEVASRMQEHLHQIGLNADDAQKVVTQMQHIPLPELARRSKAFRQRLSAAGFDTIALRTELALAMNAGDQAKVDAIMANVREALNDAEDDATSGQSTPEG